MLVRVVEQLGLNLVIVGEGEERKNLPERYLVGQKSLAEVKKIYNQSDLFVLPSNYEGWGLTAIEALASGLPVIMTDTGCAHEVIIDGETGLVVPVGDEKLLGEKIRWVLDHPGEVRRLVLAGQKLLKKNYSRQRLINQFITGLKNTR
jgi:mannosyltransferase